MNKIIRFGSSAIILIVLGFITNISSFSIATQAAAPSDNISIWSPVSSVTLEGIQTFKALVQDMPLDQYTLYWQVDNGQLNLMHDSETDVPHKEVDVDVDPWHWQSSGLYNVNFVAKNNQGETIGEKSIQIRVDSGVVTSDSASLSSNVSIASSAESTTLGTDINVWWPKNGETLSGIHSFKAELLNTEPSNYLMFWSVDKGQYNIMESDYTEGPHKEADVSVDPWTWNITGSYSVEFIAQDKSGKEIARKEVIIKANSNSSVQSPTPSATPTPLLNEQAPTPSPTLTPSPTPVVSSTPSPTVSPVQTINPTPTPTPILSTPTPTPTPTYVPTPTPTPTPTPVARIQSLTAAVVDNEIDNSDDVVTTTPKPQAKKKVTPTPSPSKSPTPTPTPTPSAAPKVSASNPLRAYNFYVDVNNNAAQQEILWKYSRPEDSLQMQKISLQPQAKWFGDWNPNIESDVRNYVDDASANGAAAVMIAYNIPGRDCGNYSAGGAHSAEAYKAWIDGMARGIGSRNAIVVLEPDALPLMNCLSSSEMNARYDLLRYAIKKLKAAGGTHVYMDAGNSNWIPAKEMSERLTSAGLADADGFALNVSNFYPTNDLVNFGKSVSSLTGGKHFIVDTSRNGAGSNGEWCNPSGRALGTKPTTATGHDVVDAFLWLKAPGESDGSCNGGPSAGTWWADYALGLAQRAGF